MPRALEGRSKTGKQACGEAVMRPLAHNSNYIITTYSIDSVNYVSYNLRNRLFANSLTIAACHVH
jgi:hypothetical protein